MFDDARTGDRSVFGHVTDDERRAARTFGKLDQRLRAIANLAEAAGVRLRRGQPRRLDRIDDEYLGGRDSSRSSTVRRLVCANSAIGASICKRLARNLTCAADSSPQTYATRAVLAQPCGELQQQGGFSGSRRPADQRDARRYDSAAQGCIELGQAGAHPLDVRFVDVSEHHGFAVGDCPGRRGARGGHQKRAFVERVPGVAGRASPQPARRFESARGTRVHRSGLGHRPDVLQRTRNNRPVPGHHPLQIAIDGPAASGKTTVARLLAQRLGVPYLDTGAMYRALAYLAVRTRTDADNAAALVRLAAAHPLDVLVSEDASAFVIRAGEETLDDAVLQSNEVTAVVSTVAAHAAVRELMVAAQRRAAENADVVMAGRDIGTVVLPHAPVKIFLTASVAARVARRRAQLELAGVPGDVHQLSTEIEERDRLDRERAVSPLVPADDASILDSSDLTADEVVEQICSAARAAGYAR